MGIQEKEIVELYREMQAERHGAKLTSDGLAILTAARVLKRAMEKCAIEICGAIEGLKQPDKYAMTLPQARAILEMDCIAYSEGQGPETDADFAGWDAMVEQAEILTGEKAIRDRTPEHVIEAVERAKAYHMSQEEARREIANLMEPEGP